MNNFIFLCGANAEIRILVFLVYDEINRTQLKDVYVEDKNTKANIISKQKCQNFSDALFEVSSFVFLKY